MLTNKSQRGATLVVALVILAVLSVIGVATMQNSTSQERMANNSRQKMIAETAAESALREAEQWLRVNVSDREALKEEFIVDPRDGFYTNRELPQLLSADPRPLENSMSDISDDDVWLADEDLSIEIDNLGGNWARNPRVVVELLGQYRLGTESGAGSSVINLDGDTEPGFNNSWVFRITAIGWSQNEDIYSVLRSTFITGRQFGG